MPSYLLAQQQNVCVLQSRYIERAPGCKEPPPVPFQHKKGPARKSAPKPGTIEEARQQASASRKLSRVGLHCNPVCLHWLT